MAPPTWADIAVGIMRIAATAPIIESLPSRIQASLGCGCRCRSRRANIINRISGSPVRRQAGAIVFGPTMLLCGDKYGVRVRGDAGVLVNARQVCDLQPRLTRIDRKL